MAGRRKAAYDEAALFEYALGAFNGDGPNYPGNPKGSFEYALRLPPR